MKAATILATCLALAASAIGPAQAVPPPAPSEDAYESRTVTWPTDRDLNVGELAEAAVDYDSDQPSVTIRLQRRDDATWVDVSSQTVGTGPHDLLFPIPTDQPASYSLRVQFDPTAEFPTPRYSDVAAFTVSSGPLPSSITLSTSKRNGRTVASGKVTGGADRTVRLELKTPNGWLPVASTASGNGGKYSLPAPRNWFYAGKLRAATPATDEHQAAASANTFKMNVRPGYKPRGRASHWTPISDARWDPCQTVTYKVNTRGAPRNALRQARQAFRVVQQATGIRFSYDGSTRAIPFRGDGGPDMSDASFTLAWGTERQVPGLRGPTIGLGGGYIYGDQVVRGLVTLDRSARLRPGFGKGSTLGTLLLHEIGHAVGLGHTTGRQQVMYPMLLARPKARFDAGDLRGLRVKGASNGCLPGAVTARVGELTPFVLP